MDLRKLKKLIDLVQESGISELEVTEGEEKVRIAKHYGGAVAPQTYMLPAAAPMPMAGAPGASSVNLDEDDEIEKKVMVMNASGACIGCGACARVCPTNCQTHAPAA